MIMSYCLFYIFSCFAIISSLFVIFTKNPIFSVLFLIFAFTNVSCILFLLNFEFLPIAFIIIYVGAIAVLFLFVLMMLNIKMATLQKNDKHFLPMTIVFFFIFIFELLFLFCYEYPFLSFLNKNSTTFLTEFLSNNLYLFDFNLSFGTNYNIKTVAIALFSDYLYAFLMADFVLLLAMISAVILIMHKNFVSKKQNIYAQLMADFDNTIVKYSA